jgi:hypothetical protein
MGLVYQNQDGVYNMTLFNTSEKAEFLATQCTNYDRYACCEYFLEQVEVDGKCGLVCGERSDEYGTHEKVLLPPVYSEIMITKISGPRAIYEKYAVFADGKRMGQFTLVLNAWVPGLTLQKN